MYPPGTPLHLRHAEWSELLERISAPASLPLLLLGLALAARGAVVVAGTAGRRTAVSLGLTCAFCLFLTYFGSFVPVASSLQPIRFLMPAFAFMAILAGAALGNWVERLGLPVAACGAATALAMALAGLVLGRPAPLELPPEPDPLAEFVARRTEAGDRLLIQSPDGYGLGDFETKILPMTLDREVIGSNYPVVYDPAQFLRTVLLGRPLEEWSPREVVPALERWGVAWAFTSTPNAHELFAAALGDPGEPIGTQRVFRIGEAPSRFLAGSGTVVASFNRLELSDLRADRGRVVIRYRYHPAWRATPGIPVERYPIPEGPSGFIALENPPESVTLRFQPWDMLRARWPAE